MQAIPEEDPAQNVALFRNGLIADLVRTPVRSTAMGPWCGSRLGTASACPAAHLGRVSEVLATPLSRGRPGGAPAAPWPVAGHLPALAEWVVALKERRPRLGTELAIRKAWYAGLCCHPIESTVHRLLAAGDQVAGGLVRGRTPLQPPLRR